MIPYGDFLKWYSQWLAIFIGIFLTIGLVHVVDAGEIQYARLRAVRDADAHIRYSGPAGKQHFRCSMETHSCQLFGEGDEEPSLFPDMGVSDDVLSSTRSSDGRYVLLKTERSIGDAVCPCADDTEEKTYTYTLYNMSGVAARQVAVLPVTRNVVHTAFSWMNESLVLFGKDGTVTVYTIATGEVRSIHSDHFGLSYRTISPKATYVAAYHSTAGEYRIWNTYTGARITIPARPSGFFAEFSYDETQFTFLDERNGDPQTLYAASLAEGGVAAVKRVFATSFTISDFIFGSDGLLYVVGNTPENPYRWVLYRYDPETESTTIVQEAVSYGGWLRDVGEYGVLFFVIEGKNTHVALYSSATDTTHVLRAVPPSPASEDVVREVVTHDGVYGVLYKPVVRPRDAPLFVWLHGGPIRQTSFGYHPYGSYAAFDELLERFVAGGSYVLKVDFAGSYGYGKAFTHSLKEHLGSRDATQVVKMTRAVQKKFRNIDRTYLIGLSYGGYLGPKVLVDHQRHFDGAVAINGVFDWFIWLAENPDYPSFKMWFNDSLPDVVDREKSFSLYTQASILKNLPELDDDKKVLLVYGENDRTVLPTQTKEFYYFARLFGKDVHLLRIEDEGHIITKRENLDLLCQYIVDNLALKKVSCSN